MRRINFILLALVGLVLLNGCFGGGGIERADDYRLLPPKTWQPYSKSEGDAAYVLVSRNRVTVSSSCHRHADADLQVLTRHLLLGARDISFTRQTYMTVDGGRGLYSSTRARIEKRPVQMEILVLSKNDCIFDFVLVGKGNLTGRDKKEFRDFIKSFHYGKK